ncbi:MAG: hypothetical protein GX795_01245 [Firmicutes bacterium]|jgi:hypothetical protein|nr:hypothetical protein [Bacillota bacterium]
MRKRNFIPVCGTFVGRQVAAAIQEVYLFASNRRVNMQVSFTMELVYLVIGLIIGIILGINLSVLYSRIFGPRSAAEKKLRRQIQGLETRIRDKDRYIKEAIRSAKREGADSE